LLDLLFDERVEVVPGFEDTGLVLVFDGFFEVELYYPITYCQRLFVV
jgi:hypothetical protein